MKVVVNRCSGEQEVGIGSSWETQSAYLGPRGGVARCDSATCGSADGNDDGGAAFKFCGADSESVTICVSSRSVGVVGGGRAISYAGATTGPYRHTKVVSISCLDKHSVKYAGLLDSRTRWRNEDDER